MSASHFSVEEKDDFTSTSWWWYGHCLLHFECL